jgi:transposase InsO family protein
MEAAARAVQRSRLRNATFTIFAGSKHAGKPVARFRSDRAGRFDISLPEGTYCVMGGEHGPAPARGSPVTTAAPNVDAECMRERALACDALLRVRGNSTREVKLTLETFTRCPQTWAQPCYRGPMPP